MRSARLVPSLRGPLILQLLPVSPSSSSCSSRRVRQLSLSALANSFLPGAGGPVGSSKPGRPTSRRSGFSKRRSPLRTGGKVRGIPNQTSSLNHEVASPWSVDITVSHRAVCCFCHSYRSSQLWLRCISRTVRPKPTSASSLLLW